MLENFEVVAEDKYGRALLAIIGRAELADVAFERWTELEQIEGEDWASEQSSEGEEQSSEITHLHEDDIIYLIDSLFSLLPSISSIRQSHLLSLETRNAEARAERVFEAQKSTVAGPSSDIQEPAVDHQTYQKLLERNLTLAHDLGVALQNDEEFARSQHIPKVKIFSPVLQKENERLIEYRDAMRRAGRDIKMDTKAQSELHSALADAAKNLLVSVEASDVIGSKGETNKTKNMDKELEGLLSVYRNINDRLGSTIRVG